MPETADHPNAATDRELLDLAGRLHEAYQEAEPGHRLYAAAREADRWAQERYRASRELLRQHRESQKALLALAGRAAAAEERAEISARNAGESADRAAALALYAALEALLAKVHAADKALQSLYALAHVHGGWDYNGPTYEKELKDAAAALAQARGEDTKGED